MPEERKLKLIWDFKGPDSGPVAKHHALHLREYSSSQELSLNIIGTEKISEDHSIAFMVVTDSEMPGVRNALRPHRGKLYEDPA